MGKEVVLVSNVLKEVNLVFSLEQSSGNAMYYSISPALNGFVLVTAISRERFRDTYLIVEASRSVEVVEILCICFATPEIHIGDFKIAPDLESFGVIMTAPGKDILHSQ